MKFVLLLSLFVSFNLFANTQFCAQSQGETACVTQDLEGNFFIEESTYERLLDHDVYLNNVHIISSQEYASLLPETTKVVVVPESSDKDVKDPVRCVGAIVGSAIVGGATGAIGGAAVGGHVGAVAGGVAGAIGSGLHTGSTADPCKPKPGRSHGPQLGNH